MWRHALQGEASAPTAQLSGLCAITEARFLQFADSVEIEVDVPAATKARDVRLELSAETWDLELAGHLAFEQLGGSFCGAIRPDRTAWLLDDAEEGSETRVLHITLEKRKDTPLWGGLTQEPPRPANYF